jgi:iron complex transport system substrate-binding protein
LFPHLARRRPTAGLVVGTFQSQAALNVQRARDLGMPTIPSLSRIEATPLGRAEWIKAIGALFNHEDDANRFYEGVAQRDHDLSRRAAASRNQPRAFWATTYASGVWLAARNSYQARLLEDAGAINPLAGRGPTVTTTVGPETIVDLAGDAEYWLTENSTISTRIPRGS